MVKFSVYLNRRVFVMLNANRCTFGRTLSEDTDQPAQSEQNLHCPHEVINHNHLVNNHACSLAIQGAHGEDWSDCVDSQTDLRLR